MEGGDAGYYRLFLVRSHFLVSLVSRFACTHARFIIYSSTSIAFSPQHHRVNISFYNSLIYPPSLPLVGACSQATVLFVICYVFPSFVALVLQYNMFKLNTNGLV